MYYEKGPHKRIKMIVNYFYNEEVFLVMRAMADGGKIVDAEAKSASYTSCTLLNS